MDALRSALKGQYHAALAMLKGAIEDCPDDLWLAGNPPRQFWRLVYHTLHWTDAYLCQDYNSFVRWAKHRDEVESDAEHEIDSPEPYTKAEMLDYLANLDRGLDTRIDALDLAAAECGIPWYTMPKLDHQIVNIRHIQEHAGQLRDRLLEAGIDQRWVGKA